MNPCATYQTRCCECMHSMTCRYLLGNSYSDDGRCDWEPSRFSLAAATVCPACGYKYGHAICCALVEDAKRRLDERLQRMADGSMEEVGRR